MSACADGIRGTPHAKRAACSKDVAEDGGTPDPVSLTTFSGVEYFIRGPWSLVLPLCDLYFHGWHRKSC